MITILNHHSHHKSLSKLLQTFKLELITRKVFTIKIHPQAFLQPLFERQHKKDKFTKLFWELWDLMAILIWHEGKINEMRIMIAWCLTVFTCAIDWKVTSWVISTWAEQKEVLNGNFFQRKQFRFSDSINIHAKKILSDFHPENFLSQKLFHKTFSSFAASFQPP